MFVPRTHVLFVRLATGFLACAMLGDGLRARADDAIYRYEGDVLPYDPSAGWLDGLCEPPCQESVEDGHFVLRWPVPEDFVNYHLWIAQPPQTPPETLWVEWRFRSNHPIGPYFFSCDAEFAINYERISAGVFMYGDAVVSESGDDFVLGLDIHDLHTFRFESLDGLRYSVAVDGLVFIRSTGTSTDNGNHHVQMRGYGGCLSDQIPNMVNEWDFVRYGTISYGERVVAADPVAVPSVKGALTGFLDARKHAELECFAVTFDSPNYVYIDQITVESFDPLGTPVGAPVITATRRGDESDLMAVWHGVSTRESTGSKPVPPGSVLQMNRNAPDTVEIVLDRPIPMPGTTRFTIDDGVATNVIEYTFAPGDTDGDGRVTLRDFAYFQTCFGSPTGASGDAPYGSLTGPCRALDLAPDGNVTLSDLYVLLQRFVGP